MSRNGFTLIELVVIIVILGVLSAQALPRYLDLSSDARLTALTQLKVSVKSANDLIFLKSKLPSYATRPVPGRADLLDVDLNQDGLFEVFSAANLDVRLKYLYLDNTDIKKRIEFSSDFVIEEQGISYTYIGYDFDGDGKVKDDNCYFEYTQAQSFTTPATYEIIKSSC